MHRGGLVYICMHAMLWYNFYQQAYGDKNKSKMYILIDVKGYTLMLENVCGIKHSFVHNCVWRSLLKAVINVHPKCCSQPYTDVILGARILFWCLSCAGDELSLLSFISWEMVMYSPSLISLKKGLHNDLSWAKSLSKHHLDRENYNR